MDGAFTQVEMLATWDEDFASDPRAPSTMLSLLAAERRRAAPTDAPTATPDVYLNTAAGTAGRLTDRLLCAATAMLSAAPTRTPTAAPTSASSLAAYNMTIVVSCQVCRRYA
jgi:hypothetical protein